MTVYGQCDYRGCGQRFTAPTLKAFHPIAQAHRAYHQTVAGGQLEASVMVVDGPEGTPDVTYGDVPDYSHLTTEELQDLIDDSALSADELEAANTELEGRNYEGADLNDLPVEAGGVDLNADHIQGDPGQDPEDSPFRGHPETVDPSPVDPFDMPADGNRDTL